MGPWVGCSFTDLGTEGCCWSLNALQYYLFLLVTLIWGCIMAPSRCLNQCWLFICEVLWHSTENNFTNAWANVLYNEFGNYTFKITLTSPRGQWVNIVHIHHLTHWGRVMHIWVSKLIIIGSDNGLWPGRRQDIIWTNYGILLIRIFRTHFSEIVSEIHTFSFKKMHFKMSSGK